MHAPLLIVHMLPLSYSIHMIALIYDILAWNKSFTILSHNSLMGENEKDNNNGNAAISKKCKETDMYDKCIISLHKMTYQKCLLATHTKTILKKVIFYFLFSVNRKYGALLIFHHRLGSAIHISIIWTSFLAHPKILVFWIIYTLALYLPIMITFSSHVLLSNHSAIHRTKDYL